MILEFADANSPILHTATVEVKEVTSITKKFINNMLRTMRKARGVGLAANQVGSEMRIAVIEDKQLLSHPLIMINPTIVDQSTEEEESHEGCLSIPNYSFPISRPKWVVVEYTDKNGKQKSLKAKNRLARIVMHEVDHLVGLTIEDRLE